MSICWAGLLPHPPIIVPAVGGQRRHAATQTIAACEELAIDLMAHRPDRLILISPHTPRPNHGICTWETPRIRGDFAQFGAPNCQLEIANDLTWLDHFKQRFSQTHGLPQQSLDHGAAVPLYFLAKAGWSGPTVVLGLPWSTHKTLETLGHVIKDMASI